MSNKWKKQHKTIYVRVANGCYVETKKRRSKAWKELRRSGGAMDVYLEILARRDIRKDKSGGYYCRNDGEIVLTYEQARKCLGISSNRFAAHIEKLFELGFITIQSGIGLKGVYSKFGFSEMWQNYGTEKFVKPERTKRRVYHPKGFQDKLKRRGELEE